MLVSCRFSLTSGDNVRILILTKQKDQLNFDFFLVVSPGLEELAKNELLLKLRVLLAKGIDKRPLSQLSYELCEGGINIHNLPLALGMALNSVLKIPTRILLRIKSFKCRDFPKLFNKVKKIKWNLYLAAIPSIKVSAHKSRLMVGKRIQSTVNDGIKAYNKAWTSSEKEPDVYVRFFEDECTISVDCSGDALYKRWQSKKVHQAPIRETMAAALYFSCFQKYHWHEKNIAIMDPMVGSGTILLESSFFFHRSQRQDYKGINFPIFSQLRLNEAYNQTLQSYDQGEQAIKHIIGYDINKECVSYSKSNLMQACRSKSQYQDKNVKILPHDLLSDVVPKLNDTNHPLHVIFNPPYGERIKVKSAEITSISAYFNKIFDKITSNWAPESINFVLPSKHMSQAIKVPKDYKLDFGATFYNGGIKVRIGHMYRVEP